ncbi:hypothetical protein IEQ34_006698 [Dendrobium chrysotoxum]|uniref:Uncharacterized protein n=1 Tax=Dendrobium chrysotoxum TaxID=161865 RepID=A0AAV7H690_DENCH|nr:hypothetical protein IEQ34_006698 [Dendrobium chrysotoxum]
MKKKKKKKHNTEKERTRTDEIDNKSAIRVASGWAVEESLAVRGPGGLDITVFGDEKVSGIGDGIAEAEDSGEAAIAAAQTMEENEDERE